MPAPISVMIFSIWGQEQKKERDKKEPSQFSLHLSPTSEQNTEKCPHALNTEAPNVTVTLQKQMTALRVPLAREKSVTVALWRCINNDFEGHHKRPHHGWLPLCLIYGLSVTVMFYWLLAAGSYVSSAACSLYTDLQRCKWSQSKRFRTIKLRGKV